MDLFASSAPAYQPLAARMRPRNLDDYIGQEHLLSAGKPLREAIERIARFLERYRKRMAVAA